MTKKILYDATVLVSGNVSGSLHKTGLYRFSYEVLKGLYQYKEIELYLYDIYQRERELKKFVQSEFANCKRIKVYSKFYSIVIFQIANLCDKLRDVENKKKIIVSFLAKIFKNFLSIFEKIARKIERKYFITKRLKNEIGNIETYYSTYFPIPEFIRNNEKIKKIFTIHDIIPIIHPEYFSSPFNEKILKEVVDNIGLNDLVVAVSESTKKDVLNYRKDLNNNNIVVVPEAAAEYFYKIDDLFVIENLKKKYNILNNYILSVCTIEPRKNLGVLIDAYRNILKSNPNFEYCLVLIGSYGWKSNKLMNDITEINKKYNNKIIITGFVPDDELAALYSGAYLFVYPSLYEGFGLPVLEAMQCGVPVITSNTSSLPEVVGDAGLLVNPLNIEELKDTVVKIVTNNSLREMYSKLSKERVTHFSWNITVEILIKIF